MTDTLDRLQGALSTLGMKKPVRVATTAEITLSGLQAIDGVTVAEDDRVLVKDQSDETENGVRSASTGEWPRTKDFDSPYDFVRGTTVAVAEGSVNVGRVYRVSSADIDSIGEDDITFAALDFDSGENGSAISNTTLDLDAVEGDVVDVSGAGTINAITLSEAVTKMVRFTGAATLTHSASLALPGSQSIVCAAGDWAIFRGYASSVVRCAFFQRGTSQPLITGEATVASAATTDLGSVREQAVTISGDTTITSFGSSAPLGTIKFCRMSGSLLTHSASLILPGSRSIQSADGDTCIARAGAGGSWRVLNYTRATNFHTSTTDATTTTTETDLASHTVPTGRLASNGEFITAKAWGSVTTASTAATRRVRIYFDGAVCADSSAIAQTGGLWRIETNIVRESAAGAETFGEYFGSTGGSPYMVAARNFISTAALGSTVELKVTGLCTGSSGIINLAGFIVEYGSR